LIKKEDSSVHYYHKLTEKWAQGKDQMDKIWTDEVKRNFFVYDYINGNPRFDIRRVEIPKDN